MNNPGRINLIILIGLPGSGKSTWAKHYYPHYVYIYGDGLKTSEKVQEACEQALQNNLNTIVDATNLTLERRSPLIQLGRKYECKILGVYFDIPVSVCLERIKERVEKGGNKVSRVAVYSLNKKKVIPLLEEGFFFLGIVK